ncbi:MAG: glycosyltransferase family 4 protein [Desulfobacterales bacterium]|nr:glycosyltransferase family 4 protein [Desulfobacterales bacterium]
MKVLLIGKFPPGQGGISSRSFWLCHALAAHDIYFDIVTIVPTLYRSETTGKLPNKIRLRQITIEEEPPWFIPGGGLWIERLVSAALDLANDQMPGLIEANYLVPYGFAAFTISRMLGVPLLIRHAGSDLAKLYNWKPAQRALESLIIKADFIVSTPDAVSQLPERTNSANSLVFLPRYAPDPQAFSPVGISPSPFCLLFAGKINYYWKLKALDTLLESFRLRQDWRLKMVADGKGREDFESEIKKHGLSQRITRRSFISPDQMPSLLSEATAVWAVEREGGISNFSNIVWETLSVGRPCLVSPSTVNHPDTDLLRDSPLLLVVDPEDPASVADALDKAALMNKVEPPGGLVENFDKYIEATASLYFEAKRSNKVRE